jgi:hypothetical protein
MSTDSMTTDSTPRPNKFERAPLNLNGMTVDQLQAEERKELLRAGATIAILQAIRDDLAGLPARPVGPDDMVAARATLRAIAEYPGFIKDRPLCPGANMYRGGEQITRRHDAAEIEHEHRQAVMSFANQLREWLLDSSGSSMIACRFSRWAWGDLLTWSGSAHADFASGEKCWRAPPELPQPWHDPDDRGVVGSSRAKARGKR